MDGVDNPLKNIRITSEDEEIPSRQRLGEYVMLKLRMNDGISDKEYEYRYGKSFSQDFGRKIEKYLKAGVMIRNGGRYSLTPQGMFISNYILSDILETDMLIDVPQ